MSDNPVAVPDKSPAYADPSEAVECARCSQRFGWQEMSLVQGQRYCATCAPLASAQLGAPVLGPHEWTSMEGIPNE